MTLLDGLLAPRLSVSPTPQVFFHVSCNPIKQSSFSLSPTAHIFHLAAHCGCDGVNFRCTRLMCRTPFFGLVLCQSRLGPACWSAIILPFLSLFSLFAAAALMHKPHLCSQHTGRYPPVFPLSSPAPSLTLLFGACVFCTKRGTSLSQLIASRHSNTCRLVVASNQTALGATCPAAAVCLGFSVRWRLDRVPCSGAPPPSPANRCL
jgi:hypothetical protein